MTTNSNHTIPRLIRKHDALRLVNSPRMLARMIAASKPGRANPWLRIVPPRHGAKQRDLLIEQASVEKAIRRLLNGELPPLLPYEAKPKEDDPNPQNEDLTDTQ